MLKFNFSTPLPLLPIFRWYEQSSVDLEFMLSIEILKGSSYWIQPPQHFKMLTFLVNILFCDLQVCLEGQISRKSAMKSLSEGRSPSGDQIPWKFCEQFQDNVFPSLSGARIVRIAVHPSAVRVRFIAFIELCYARVNITLHNLNILLCQCSLDMVQLLWTFWQGMHFSSLPQP